MKIITLLSDFGGRDSYVAQMKGVACSLSDARLVDITHEIPAHNIRQGAFHLWMAAGWFPKGTVHVAVVDPGVGTTRRGLFVVGKNYVFVGPDNGVLLPACHAEEPFTVYEITHPGFQLAHAGQTFDGRDLFAPVAAYITMGVPFETLGRPTTSFVDLQFPIAQRTEDVVSGAVLYIDRFGNLITNIRAPLLPRLEGRLRVTIGGHEEFLPVVRSYGFALEGEPLAMVGSSGFLEIAVNKGNAASRFQATEDASVAVRVV
jgi:hypothetical protein